ncbi:MAG: TonB-dependent receptor [Pyrinomonadaceae bacterium]
MKLPSNLGQHPRWSKEWSMLSLFAAVFLLSVSANFAQSPIVSGVIIDRTGAVVPAAAITLYSSDSSISRASSDGEGKFSIVAPNAGLTKLTVSAPGFREFSLGFTPAGVGPIELSIVLELSPVVEQMTVTANRTESLLGDTPASVVVVDAKRLSETAAVTLDDALRQVPGFTLFRRTGSRAANPTTQGVSLRATGASGASRAVVMADGIPVNDPFGGWVYWNTIPRESISRVEVLRGGASSLYGSAAMGGVINIVSREPTVSPFLSLSVSGGTQSTFDSSIYASAGKGPWSGSLAASDFATHGYIPINRTERGPIDTAAASRTSALTFKLTRSFANGGRFFAAASTYGESRRNGTPGQINRTHQRRFQAGGDWANDRAGAFTLRVYGGTQVFDQTFTAINALRTSETLTRLQRSPAQQVGVSFQWSRAWGSHQAFVAGVEAKQIRGASDEIAYTGGQPTSLIGADGRERDGGVFVQEVIQFTPRFQLTAGARFDRWRNYQAVSATRPLTGNALPTLTRFGDRDESAFSPQLSALFKLSHDVSLNASFSRAFRAPSLNELYRSFRVGNVLTLANERLRAERLTGGEAGLATTQWSGDLFVRGTVFWTEIVRPIANVTLNVTPALITRQRQNLGRTRSAGVELEAEARIQKYWTISGGYLFAAATVLEFPANRSLEGLRLPQVARQQLTFQARFSRPEWLTVSIQGRSSSPQFDDDQNLLKLARYFSLDAYVSRKLGPRCEIFAAGENLTNQRYDVGRTPVRTIGPPLSWRGGLRIQFGH